MKKTFLSFVLFFLFFSYITLEGRITVKGNEPFAYLAIITKDKEYKITGKLTEEIRQKYQNKTLKVKGKLIKKDAAPGFPAELEVVKIIKIY